MLPEPKETPMTQNNQTNSPNYSTHAIECFTHYLPSLPPQEQSQFQHVISLLHKAVKFILPTNGCLFGDDFSKGYDIIDHTLLYLPYPIVALEYPYNLFNPKDKGFVHSPKRIALALDVQANINNPLVQQALPYFEQTAQTGGIIVLAINYIDTLWVIQAFGAMLPRIPVDSAPLTTYYYRKNKPAQVGMRPFVVLPTPAKQLIEKLGPDAAIRNSLHDIGEEITSTIGLLAALSCSNVKYSTIPAPNKLNLKRAKSNKLPFYEYKELYVDVQGSHNKSSQGSGLPSGRQSPREHLRRGHIRRLSTNRNVWVQSAVVGACRKGHIDKAYVLR